MSDSIHHECGLALLRLKKPLDYYRKKYGSTFYGLAKMYLLMEKQHNRGQDGAGLASIKTGAVPGSPFIDRVRSNSRQSIADVFEKIDALTKEKLDAHPEKADDGKWLKENVPFAAELYLGHVRYGTYGGSDIEAVHPFMRENISKSRNLVVAGNFNMTNVDVLFQRLIEMGHHPVKRLDSITVMERIGHFVDEESTLLYNKFKAEGCQSSRIPERIEKEFNLKEVLVKAAKRFDGGFAIAGMVGHGDAFALRDPSGIRPVFYYQNDEIAIAASERAAIQTAFDAPFEEVKELPRGQALIISREGEINLYQIMPPLKDRACSFERIYFSRGNDAEIYRERKKLGYLLTNDVLKAVGGNVENTVFSYIPNTSESAYIGLMEGVDEKLTEEKIEAISNKKLSAEQIKSILSKKIRREKIAIKDAKLRTFITEDAYRDEFVGHVYDVTYGVIRPNKDKLVLIDDSIVRGTTLKKSIIRIMDKLRPEHIIIVSSAPQVRYPDCYGIDMTRLEDFIAFRAAIAMLKESGREKLIHDIYKNCLDELKKDDSEQQNCVKAIYEPFSDDEISEKISEMATGSDIKAKVSIVFQSIENLHEACPKNLGDWYFTGDYPTAGGIRVVNRSFVNFMEGNK